MYQFLMDHRDDLVARCAAKVATRPQHPISEEQIATGVPLILEQLIATLRAEEEGDASASLTISGAAGGNGSSDIGVGAAAQGQVLLELGYTIDEVVHNYGDLCQAVTDLAVELDAPFAIDEFRTLNRCLDNAIASAVAEFAGVRDQVVASRVSADEVRRMGFLVHELRNHLQTATMSFAALEAGKLTIAGSTAGLLKRNLSAMASLLTQAISDVRSSVETASRESFALSTLVADAEMTGSLQAKARGCRLIVLQVDPALSIMGNRVLLTAALVNLLQNAFKYTRPNTDVTLSARGVADRILIEVQDHCGGLPKGVSESLFKPFTQASPDRSGLGLGLSIARQSVEADRGLLSVRDLPGNGCIFSIDLPRHEAE